MSAVDAEPLRLALFPPGDGGMARPRLERREICRTGDIAVLYTGQRLDPSDLGVYLQLVQLADRGPGREEAKVSALQLLEATGRRYAGQAEWLDDAINRLCGALLEIRGGELRYSGVLLKDSFLDQREGTYTVRVDMRLAIFVSCGLWLGATRLPE
jgi:hypothetical protein